MNLMCVNKNCKAELKYLRGGRLFLMERKLKAVPAQANPAQMQGGNTPPPRQVEPPRHHVALRRYFWLCESCSQDYVIRNWTENGVELAPRQPKKRMHSSPFHSREWFMPGLVG